MANPLKPELEIVLDKPYKARLTIDAIMQIEQKLGCGIIKLVTNVQNMDILLQDVVSVLTPALRGGGNDVQEADVKKMVSQVGIIKATEVMANLLVSCLAVDSEENEKGKKDIA